MIVLSLEKYITGQPVVCSQTITSLRVCVYIYTSSAAQGGGGSFKNRKPIGEFGCCESGMAERSH